MKPQDFTITIVTNKSPLEAFHSISDVSGWWTGDPGMTGHSLKTGDEFTYRHQDIHYSRQRVTEMVPGKKIGWLVTDSQLNFIKDKNEWTGTTISFEIIEKNDKAEIRFTHYGLASNIECYKDCSAAWNYYINESLKNFITK